MTRHRTRTAAIVGLLLVAGAAGTWAWVAAAQEPKPGFVNIIRFPDVHPGKDAEFVAWFRWSNEVYARHPGFVSRTLVKPMDGAGPYVGIVEHESRATFMAMHESADRAAAFERVAPLLARKPTPEFYEVAVSTRK